MIKIYIKKTVKITPRLPFFLKKKFKKIIKYFAASHSIKGDIEINIIIINNLEIKKLSKQYKKENKVTDVLSFPTNYQKLKNIIGYNMLGDIFISYEKINEQARKYNHSRKREWLYLLSHGTLHLLGHDHQNKKTNNNMNMLTSKVMDIIKVSR